MFRLRARYEANEQALRSQLAGTALIRLTGALTRVNQVLRDAGTEENRIDIRPDTKNVVGFLEGKKAANRVRLQNEPTNQLG